MDALAEYTRRQYGGRKSFAKRTAKACLATIMAKLKFHGVIAPYFKHYEFMLGLRFVSGFRARRRPNYEFI